MCNEMELGIFLLEHVPDWFVLPGQLKLLDKYKAFFINYLYDRAIEWYEVHQKGKAQKSNFKEELLPIAWHLDRVMDWRMSEDEKRRWKQHLVVFDYLIQKFTPQGIF